MIARLKFFCLFAMLTCASKDMEAAQRENVSTNMMAIRNFAEILQGAPGDTLFDRANKKLNDLLKDSDLKCPHKKGDCISLSGAPIEGCVSCEEIYEKLEELRAFKIEYVGGEASSLDPEPWRSKPDPKWVGGSTKYPGTRKSAEYPPKDATGPVGPKGDGGWTCEESAAKTELEPLCPTDGGGKVGEFKRHFKAFKEKTERFRDQMAAIQEDYKQAYAKFAEGIAKLQDSYKDSGKRGDDGKVIAMVVTA